MKKIISLVLCFILVCACVPMSIFAESNIYISIDGNLPISIDTTLYQDRTLLSFKTLVNRTPQITGTYNETTNELNIIINDINAILKIDSYTIQFENKSLDTDYPPTLIDGNPYISIRTLFNILDFGSDKPIPYFIVPPDEAEKDNTPTTIPSATESKYKDVSQNDSHYKYIETLSKLGIINGYSDGTFKPDNTITRAEFTTIICRLLNKTDEAKSESSKSIFNDVPTTYWASGYINLANKLGIISGVGNNIFDPESNVTKVQAIKMILNAGGYEQDNEIQTNGYPTGYMNKFCLLTKINEYAYNSPLDRKTAAEYLYKILNVRIYDNKTGMGLTYLDNIIGPIEMDNILKQQIINNLQSQFPLDDTLPKNSEKPIFVSQLMYVKNLDTSSSVEKIRDLDGIQYLANLNWLNIENQDISDLSPIVDNSKRYIFEILDSEYKEKDLKLSLYGNYKLSDISILEKSDRDITIFSYPYTKLNLTIDEYETYCNKLNLIKVLNNDELYDKFRICEDLDNINQLGDYETTLEKMDRYIGYLETASSILDNITNSNMSDRDKVTIIHDYIINNCEYDYNLYNKLKDHENKFETPTKEEMLKASLSGVLYDKKSVCEGYAQTFYLLCSIAKIPCAYITGLGKDEAHAWNAIWIEETQLYIDTTWDDTQGGNKYLLIPETQINTDHVIESIYYNSLWDKNHYETQENINNGYYE